MKTIILGCLLTLSFTTSANTFTEQEKRDIDALDAQATLVTQLRAQCTEAKLTKSADLETTCKEYTDQAEIFGLEVLKYNEDSSSAVSKYVNSLNEHELKIFKAISQFMIELEIHQIDL